MKKDYSRNTLTNLFGLSLPNVIVFSFCHLLFIPLVILYKYNLISSIFLNICYGIILAFIVIPLGGYLLFINCTNYDSKKCKKCKNWNCKGRGVFK